MSTAVLDIPILDPRNEAELVEQAIQLVYEASGQLLNDYSPHSPTRALIEGLCFACAELLWWVNKLPDAIAIAFLKNAGVERILGTKAVATIQFNLTAPLGTAFTVPQGFSVSDSSGNLLYYTDDVLVISPGSITGTITATAAQDGADYNLSAFAINTFQVPLAFLGTIANPQPASGGAGAETIEQTKARGLEAIRSRKVLITADDYQDAAQVLLGVGSRAFAVPLLGSDKVSEKLSAVHVFCLNADGTAPTETQLNEIKLALQDLVLLGSLIYVSALEVEPIDIYAIAKYAPGLDPSAIAADIWTTLQNSLSPLKATPGQSVLVKEAEYQVRSTPGVDVVQSVTLNGLAGNVPMANKFTVPQARSLYVELVNQFGQVAPFAFGTGDPD